MQHRSLKSVRLSVSSIFLIHGLVVASWASQIPVFQGNLHLSPVIVGRLLMTAAAGSVFAMPIAGWLIHRFGSTVLVIVTTLGFCLSLPSIAAAGSVLTLSIALPFYGAMSGSMDVAMNTHAVLLEKQYQRHIMSSFHALFSFGGMIGSALGALATSKGISAGAHLWSSGIALAMASMVAFRWLRLPSNAPDAKDAGSPGHIRWCLMLWSLVVVAFAIMLVEGAIADWSGIYIRSALRTGPGLAALGYAAFSGAMAVGRLTGDYLTARLGREQMVYMGALLGAVGLVVALLLGTAESAIIGFTCTGIGLATIIPNTFAGSGNIKDSAAGPSLAVVSMAGYLGFLLGPPAIGFVAQLSSIRAALWILAGLCILSSLASWTIRRTSPLSGTAC